MKRLLIALLAVTAGTVVGCVDENNEVQLPDQNGIYTDIVFGELVTETGQCSPGDVIKCYTGDPNTVNVGICQPGYYQCIQDESGKWVWDGRECVDEVLPDYTYPCSSDMPEADFDCNGTPDNMQDEDGDGLTVCSDNGYREDDNDNPFASKVNQPTKAKRNKLKNVNARDFEYTGSVQTVTLNPGRYKLEVWGAQGGGRGSSDSVCQNIEDIGKAGNGGYSSGVIELSTKTTLYVYVGGKGKCKECSSNSCDGTSWRALGGFNGGGYGYTSQEYEPGGGGGGATDIRVGTDSLYARVIVAGGGGGGGEDYSDTYGDGGGASGSPNSNFYGASQISAGSGGGFGYGGNTNKADGGGGGGGWFGGGTISNSTLYSDSQGGGGGSGFVYTSSSAANTASSYTGGTWLLNSSHYLKSTQLLGGNVSFTSPTGVLEQGHRGDGYARITALSDTGGEDFAYTGSVQSVMLDPGSYKLEVWGAQGGHRSPENSGYYNYNENHGVTGRGGYSVGTIKLTEKTRVYVYVGGEGNTGTCDPYSHICTGGFNGGGYRYMYKGGGGATDIRIGTDSLYSRVIVAGGGGSDGSASHAGGVGGGYEGGESIPDYCDYHEYDGMGGGQTFSGQSEARTSNSQNKTKLSLTESEYSAYSDYNYSYGGFGFGGGGLYCRDGFGGAGGGGWYGGAGTIADVSLDDDRGGGGGSGYVYTSWSATSYPSGCQLSAKYYLKNAELYDGSETFAAPSGIEEEGHVGNGYARITPVPDVVEEEEEYTDFGYTGAVQPITLEPGKYRFQVWGAQGGYRSSSQYGGRGGYSEGVIEIKETTKAYVYVGGEGKSGVCTSDICAGGFNGGGYRYKYKGGGGATDIRLVSDSLFSRVIVAGGGGSDGAQYAKGGFGGGADGGDCDNNYCNLYQNISGTSYSYDGKGGTQNYSGGSAFWTRSSQAKSNLFIDYYDYQNDRNAINADYAKGGFGFGGAGGYMTRDSCGDGSNISGYGTGGAGGGGWYGGTGAVPDCCCDDDDAGGGGSGYVYTDATYMNYPAGCLLNSKYYMSETKVRSGNTSFKSPNGGNEKGHTGNGFARITRLDKPVTTVKVQDFEYTGTVQPITLAPGQYKLEVWGAQGGDAGCYNTCSYIYGYSAPQSSCPCGEQISALGGKGGYSTGVLTLTEKTDAYIYVGGAGTDSQGIWVALRFPTGNVNYPGGFNGGGDGNEDGMSGGGGASDIRLGTDSLYSRVIVAGGGGGGGNAHHDGIHLSNGGFGGGLQGGTSSQSEQFENRVPGKGGTQIGVTLSYYSSITAGFGRGGGGKGDNLRGGGGGGWYGGTQGNNSTGGGGGSGYVYTSSTFVNYPEGGLLTDKYYLTEAYTLGGDVSFKAPNGSDEIGHSGNGHVRISTLGLEECHDFCVTYQDEFEISDTSCGVPTDTVMGVTPSVYEVQYCANYYDESCESTGCTACSELIPMEVYLPGYGNFYTFGCDPSNYYVSYINNYDCRITRLDASYSYWGYTSVTPVNKNEGALQLAKAMDICWSYDKTKSDSFGLIEAESEVSQGDKNFRNIDSLGSLISSAQVAVKDGMRKRSGEVQISPQGGATFALLSTGKATDAHADSDPSGSYGSCSDAETIPPVYSKAHSSSLRTNSNCSDPSVTHCDPVRLHLKLKAPEGAKGFSFDFRFFSMEYPYYVCSAFNDFFLALVTDEEGNAIVDTNGDGSFDDEDGNVAFDKNGNPVTINSGFFTTCYAPVCDSGDMGYSLSSGCPGNYSGCTDGHCGVCEDGVDDLYAFTQNPYIGSGDGEGGATAWLTTFVPISSGQVFNLDFYIWDTSDSAYDSSVLIDNFKWRTKATEVGTFISGEVVEQE